MAIAEEAVPEKKGSPLILQIVILLAMTAVALGVGWFAGGYLYSSSVPIKPEQSAQSRVPGAHATGKKAEAGKSATGKAAADAAGPGGVITLEPIVTNLEAPKDVWVRIEVSLVFAGVPDKKIADAVSQDFLAYLRTVRLEQLQGPSGYQHLRSDLLERARIRSKGAVSQVLVKTLLFE